MAYKYAGKFIPYSRDNLPEKIPKIVYESQQLQELSRKTGGRNGKEITQGN